MRIFLVGDSYGGTGLANVTKYYIEYLPKGTLYQKNRSKVMRVPELFVKIAKADVVAMLRIIVSASTNAIIFFMIIDSFQRNFCHWGPIPFSLQVILYHCLHIRSTQK